MGSTRSFPLDDFSKNAKRRTVAAFESVQDSALALSQRNQFVGKYNYDRQLGSISNEFDNSSIRDFPNPFFLDIQICL
jgi:hypothetical protein